MKNDCPIMKRAIHLKILNIIYKIKMLWWIPLKSGKMVSILQPLFIIQRNNSYKEDDKQITCGWN